MAFLLYIVIVYVILFVYAKSGNVPPDLDENTLFIVLAILTGAQVIASSIRK